MVCRGVLPGVEVAQAFSVRRRGPRAPMPRFARHGYLVAGVVGGPNPACGPHAKKSLRPRRKRKKEKGPFRRAPSRLKLQQRAKKRQRASPCGGGRRAEPGLRTSRHLCPEGVRKARGHSRKKPSPPGQSRHKKKACLGSALPALRKSEKIFVCAKTPTRGCGGTKVLRVYIVGEKRTSYEPSPPK